MQKFSLPITKECNGVAITITKITINKSFNCQKSDCCYSEDKSCEFRKAFCLSSTSKMLKFTEIEIIIYNKSPNIDFEFNRVDCQLIDDQHFSYNTDNGICNEVMLPRYEYFYNQKIKPNIKTKGILVFPEVENNLCISRLMLYGSDGHYSNCFMFDFNFCKFSDETEEEYNTRVQPVNNLSEPKQPLSNSTSYEIGQIERGIAQLNRYIFQRLNNLLTKSDKIKLQNNIMNIEFQLKQEIQALSEPQKGDYTKKVDNIISDYNLNLSGNNDLQTSIFERTSRQGAREDLGTTEFRSSWEANIARILNHNKVSWNYEKLPFKMGDICYLPDFFINDDTIIEVKGFWDTDSINKVNAFIRNHSEYKTLIVDYDMYPTLNELYSVTQPIPFWETTIAPQGQETNITIVGIAYCDKNVIEKLHVGEHLILEIEPNNIYDDFAVAVKNKDGESVGHLERELAPIYKQKLELGMAFDIVIAEKRQKVLKAKIKRVNWDEIILFDMLESTNNAEISEGTSNGNIYCVGDKVEHSKFGIGTVVALEESNIVCVAFKDVGVKKMSAALGNLRIIT